MPRGSKRGVRDVLRRRGKWIVFLLFVALMPLAINQYVVQEGLVVLAALAFAFVPVLLVLIAFVLLQEGIGRTLLALKTVVAHFALWNHVHLWAGRLRGRP